MKKILTGFWLLIAVTVSAQSSDVRLVKKTFSNYKKSILEGNGAEAVKWVDSKTISYYDSILNLSIYGDSTTIQNLDIISKLTVLTLRHRIPVEEVLTMKGREFFIYSIDKGMIGKNSVKTIEIGEVKLEGNFAEGQMVANGQESPIYFQFNKEDGIWKLDITSVFAVSNEGLKKMIAGDGNTENEFVFKTLEILTGKPVMNTIWSPLK
jgi:hypothetical protein